ncbi:MAG: CopG family transcriptional regulator [Rhizobacter sp.]|nr:CopG family transcriptional regulator [Burkholderiales bacterium]
MNTLTIKLSAPLDAALAEASTRAQLTKSELVRRAVIAYLAPGGPHEGIAAAPSALALALALALAGDLVRCFKGGPSDLASNPRHLDVFGLS